MKLVRVAMFYLTPVPEGWDTWSFCFGKVTVTTMRFGKAPSVTNSKRLLLKAETQLTSISVIDADGVFDVPEVARRKCERALEIAADTVAVFSKRTRNMASA